MCVRQLLRDRWEVDRVGERGQHGLHLEPADQGDRPEADWAHGRGVIHGLPPNREHYRVCQPGG